MSSTEYSSGDLKFDGSNWEDLDRIVGLAKFTFLQDDDYDDNELRKCAYLAQQFTGPALDWSVSTHQNQPAVFNDFDGFVVAVQQAFGVEANGIQALRRGTLDSLAWSKNVPVFFAEFDRLTLQLGIGGHGTKIAMVQSKLPLSIKAELARQALDFNNYETMRERLITMWALDPGRASSSSNNKKPRCGTCGKRGHLAADCKAKK
jgi:hypothetical protein